MELACSSVMQMEGTYSLLEPEYTWMVPIDEQHANFDPLEDHVKTLIAPGERERQALKAHTSIQEHTHTHTHT